MATDLSQLMDHLNSDEISVRLAACEKLAQIGPDARSAAVPLCRLTADPDESVREAAVSALETLETPAIEDASALAQLMSSSAADVRFWAATLLGRLGPSAERQAPALLAAITGDQAIPVQQKAVWAIDQIGVRTASAKAALEQAAQSTDPRLARLATKALANF
ncbi:HEAT repeat domain-containing protein [Blastopirellula sp. JC732]|uniref:HEAT repeat domain-containing protein n=1 Tax=Blastopirellula sediminis TaxID=2894196 RepID=A0A9X1SET6_9BACT|nr:HEAT repeat domain-containing protein [Blastopirellula sediminis]MCC9604371.1 HEAT repeat domain-containing protein [Blastopirellula sediminis]MCC9626891.1 HEAT repeat domain-containing protein [Blastopirellula sediminis]